MHLRTLKGSGVFCVGRAAAGPCVADDFFALFAPPASGGPARFFEAAAAAVPSSCFTATTAEFVATPRGTLATFFLGTPPGGGPRMMGRGGGTVCDDVDAVVDTL